MTYVRVKNIAWLAIWTFNPIFKLVRTFRIRALLIFKKPLLRVRIRDFEPQTDNDNIIERKNDLLAEIKKRIDLEKAKTKCKDNLISLKVVYYLNKNTTITGKFEKDLDNMTKVVSDVLTDYLTEQDCQNNHKTGLGLIRDDVDIHELHLVKRFVDEDPDQGLDILLYKHGDKIE